MLIQKELTSLFSSILIFLIGAKVNHFGSFIFEEEYNGQIQKSIT
ncbi:hypothetical protein [Niallia circulans]|nr:hypothetical protein [Niallia circulans]